MVFNRVRWENQLVKSRQFATWSTSQGPLSTFRVRHPDMKRYTYSRPVTLTTLDNIYISGEHEYAVSASAICLNSIISSGHVGVSTVVLKCDRGLQVAHTLRNLTPIRVINTRSKTQRICWGFWTAQLQCSDKEQYA
ncbi:hypothetical protein PHMEG_00016458 [Phytophthora megakarya]|uniref:Uncharacterized protein n=1 Tax=Phytophthora megakarya TaxID=4795 RepID=A0A225W0C4_9STRA|nr:hypothetical protein PHMEG_00016458 [Phytophthora megakarya]